MSTIFDRGETKISGTYQVIPRLGPVESGKAKSNKMVNSMDVFTVKVMKVNKRERCAER